MGISCWFTEVWNDTNELGLWNDECRERISVSAKGCWYRSNKPRAARAVLIPTRKVKNEVGFFRREGGEWEQTYSHERGGEVAAREGLPTLRLTCGRFRVTLVCTYLYGDIQHNWFRA